MKSDDELALPVDIEDKNRRRFDRLNLKLPFLSADLHGHHVLAALVLVCFATPVVAAVYYHHYENDKIAALQIKVTTENNIRLSKLEQVAVETQRIQEALIYVIALPQEEKNKLQLSKPSKIRELERN